MGHFPGFDFATNGGIRDLKEVQLILLKREWNVMERPINATCACSKDQQIQFWSSRESIALSLGIEAMREETGETRN